MALLREMVTRRLTSLAINMLIATYRNIETEPMGS